MTQGEAMDILKMGKNVLLTGAAGSGKTYLLNDYIRYLREHGVGVAVTASTGIAATHLGGQTIHSWSGMGIRDHLSQEEILQLKENARIKRNYKNTKVLIIDEVSMLHAHQLQILNAIGRAMLDGDKPFGGLQVILSGDFFQLPPVSRDVGILDRTFAYECPAWDGGEFQVCYLHEQYRQEDDTILKILNDIRDGRAGEQTKVPLRTRYKKDPEGDMRPTRLYARNINVDRINEEHLEKLDSEEKIFEMETKGFKKLVDGLKKSCLAPETLRLKVGAEVMFVKNATDGRYVNGTRGVVVDFTDKSDGEYPVVRTTSGDVIAAYPEEWRLEDNGSVRARLMQVPLRLAWAITIHKSQGMTLDAAEIDLSDAFEPGMGYVALSRVRSLSGLKLMGLNDIALSVHPKILLHDRKFREWSSAISEALLQFTTEDRRKHHEKILLERFGGARDKSQVKKGRVAKKSTHEITRELLEKGKNIREVARERGLKEGSVISHLEKLDTTGRLPDISSLKPEMPAGDWRKIKELFEKSEDGKLTPIFRAMKGRYSFEILRLARLFL